MGKPIRKLLDPLLATVGWALLLVALLSGCSAPVAVAAFIAIGYQHERDFGGTSPGVPPDRAVAGTSSLAAPELAPDRKVNEQDCTKPIDWSLGNIRCK